jgi:hypothetical protein
VVEEARLVFEERLACLLIDTVAYLRRVRRNASIARTPRVVDASGRSETGMSCAREGIVQLSTLRRRNGLQAKGI